MILLNKNVTNNLFHLKSFELNCIKMNRITKKLMQYTYLSDLKSTFHLTEMCAELTHNVVEAGITVMVVLCSGVSGSLICILVQSF